MPTQKEGESVGKQYKTIEFDDRNGVSRTAVYAELKRGQDGVTLDKNFRPAYDPDLAQKRVQEGLRRRGRIKEGG